MFKQGTGKDDLHAHEILGVAGPLDLRTSSWKVCPQAFAAAEALLVLTAARRWGGTWLRGSAWRGWTTKIAIYPLNNLVVQIYRFYTTLYIPPQPQHIYLRLQTLSLSLSPHIRQCLKKSCIFVSWAVAWKLTNWLVNWWRNILRRSLRTKVPAMDDLGTSENGSHLEEKTWKILITKLVKCATKL